MEKSKYHEISAVIRDAHKSAVERKLWKKNYPDSYIFGLLVGEFGELLKVYQRGYFARRERFEKHMEDVRLRANGRFQEHWINAFHVYLKDSVEDEMADVVILLANLAGKRGYEIDICKSFAEDMKMDEFPSFIYQLTSYISWLEPDEYISKVICQMFCLAQHFNIDLWWHIEQKIRYNNLRKR